MSAPHAHPPPLELLLAGKHPKKKMAAGSRKKNYSSVPTLRELCLGVICDKIEKFPPEAFAMLSPDEFDSVIQKRWKDSAPENKTGGLDGTGRRLPALNAETLKEIEAVNPHLSDSGEADKLVWKDCVEYKYPSTSGDYARPKALRLPWPILVQSIKSAGDTLQQSWKNRNSADTRPLFKALTQLEDNAMIVPLMTATDIGKVLNKLVKQMNKCKQKDDDLTDVEEQLVGEPLERLDALLNKWKVLATDATRSDDDKAAVTGQGKRISDVQHRRDWTAAQATESWRDLYHALENRKLQMQDNMGATLRKSKEHLSQDRLKTRHCRIVERRGGSSKQESLLKGERGTRALALAAARGDKAFKAAAGSASKMVLLRAETQVQATFSKSGGASKQQSSAKASAFGCSIASSGPKKKRSIQAVGGQLATGEGKRMQLPQMHNVNKAKKGLQMNKKIAKLKGTRGGFITRR